MVSWELSNVQMFHKQMVYSNTLGIKHESGTIFVNISISIKHISLSTIFQGLLQKEAVVCHCLSRHFFTAGNHWLIMYDLFKSHFIIMTWFDLSNTNKYSIPCYNSFVVIIVGLQSCHYFRVIFVLLWVIFSYFYFFPIMIVSHPKLAGVR